MFKREGAKPKLEDTLKCGWCGDEIADDTEVFSFGATAIPGLDLTGLEGKVIDISLLRKDRNVQAMVVTEDSPAKRDGKDLMFVTCCESCAEALTQGLDREMELA